MRLLYRLPRCSDNETTGKLEKAKELQHVENSVNQRITIKTGGRTQVLELLNLFGGRNVRNDKSSFPSR